MERVLTFFRDNPALIALGAIVAIASLLGVIFTVAFVRAGLSLRPLVFIGVFFALILGPQIVGQILMKSGILPNLDWTPATAQSRVLRDNDLVLSSDGGRFLHPYAVFGGDVDEAFVHDARETFGPVTIGAETAQIAFALGQGESAFVARFPTPERAHEAQAQYFSHLGLPHPAPAADGTRTAPRASGDFVRTLVAGRTLFSWSGADASALERRMHASGAAWHGGGPPPPNPKRRRALGYAIGFLALNLAVVSLWFFKGSAWAARDNGRPGLERVAAHDLRAQLLAMDRLPQPITIKPTDRPDEIEVTWRYADATWLDTARARGLRRTHRLVLRLDEVNRTVRVRQYASGIDWSAGKSGLNFNWKLQTGITFFHVESERSYGLHVASDGPVKPGLSYAYKFDVQEMKRPLAQLVTSRGWTWQPLVWDAPAWLRWATE